MLTYVWGRESLPWWSFYYIERTLSLELYNKLVILTKTAIRIIISRPNVYTTITRALPDVRYSFGDSVVVRNKLPAAKHRPLVFDR